MSRFIPLLLFGAAIVCAQEFRSTITGSVTDASGASIPDAQVVAVQAETGARFRTVTTAEGHYTLSALPPGSYRIETEAKGFKHSTREGVQVSANQRIGIDIT